MKKNLKNILFIIVTLVVVTILAIGGYFIFVKKGGIRYKYITAENYEQIANEITEKLGDSDDSYYFTYACITYITKDGLTEDYFNNPEDSKLYKSIYNKTVNQLIEEGKKLMEENNMTLEKFKEQVDIINDLGSGNMNIDNNRNSVDEEYMD